MIELSNMTAQTLQPGQALTFDKVLLKTGCCECFNSMMPTSVKLKVNDSHTIYDLEFHANITADPAATVQLAIAVGGSPLPQTAMNATPAAAGTLINVSAGTYLRNCCSDLDRVSVVNTGTAPLTVAPNSSFRIVRRA